MGFVFTPSWFLGQDVLIEIFSFLILFIFSFLAFKSYKLSRKKSVLYLGIGFFLIAAAEMLTILVKFVIYYNDPVTQEIGRVITQTAV